MRYAQALDRGNDTKCLVRLHPRNCEPAVCELLKYATDTTDDHGAQP
jgi:hypothetical protein